MSAATVKVYEAGTGKYLPDDQMNESGKYLTMTLMRYHNSDGTYQYTITNIELDRDCLKYLKTVRFYCNRILILIILY